MKLVCPSCSARYEKGKFCSECGSPLSEVATKKVLFCPSCQTEVPSGKFCPECGTKLEEKEIEIGVDANSTTPILKTSTQNLESRVDSNVVAILSKYRDEFGDMRTLNKEEYAIAKEELQYCVKKGNTEAMCFLASIYFEGLGIPQDYQHAYNLLREAEKKGSKYASAKLGMFYANGIIVDADDNEAIRRLVDGYDQTKIPGIAGFAALVYMITKDYSNAFKYAQIAAEKEDKEGLAVLGLLYQNGWSVNKDEQKAFDYFMHAAALGHENAISQLGWMYETGCGVEKDYAQAFFWYNESAQKGSEIGMNNLAWCYKLGKGVEQDVEVAAEWFKKGAEAGYVNSMLELGDYYQSTLFDTEKAKYWLLKAAELGNADAMNKLGVICADNIEPNYQEAIKWWEKAIEQNQPNAYRNLALCYRDGTGVPQDFAKTIELLAKAKEFGLEDADQIPMAVIDKVEMQQDYQDCGGLYRLHLILSFRITGMREKRGCIEAKIFSGNSNKPEYVLWNSDIDLGEDNDEELVDSCFPITSLYDDTSWTDFDIYTFVFDFKNLPSDKWLDYRVEVSIKDHIGNIISEKYVHKYSVKRIPHTFSKDEFRLINK